MGDFSRLTGAGEADRLGAGVVKILLSQPGLTGGGLRRRSHSALYRSYPSRNAGVTRDEKTSSPLGFDEGGSGAKATAFLPDGGAEVAPCPLVRYEAADLTEMGEAEREDRAELASELLPDPPGLASVEADCERDVGDLKGLNGHCVGFRLVLR